MSFLKQISLFITLLYYATITFCECKQTFVASCEFKSRTLSIPTRFSCYYGHRIDMHKRWDEHTLLC